MAKRKDRLYTEYRSCPICGSKNITIFKFKRLFKEHIVVECHRFECNKNIEVKEIKY